MKNKINCYFRNLTPIRSDDEILYRVLRKAEEMENTKGKSKIRIKKTIIAVCAVIAATALGITSAAAAGIIKFDKIFGNYITAESEELGDNLINVESDFRYYVSDDNYTIELKGVTGSASEIIANLELKRTDGKPVIDYFVNEYIPGENISSADKVKCIEQYGYNRYTINESGNIEIDLNLCAVAPISDEVLTAQGYGFYPSDSFFDFLLANNVGLENIPEVDTSSIVYLPVEWSFSFSYTPTEKALIEIEAEELNTTVCLNATSYMGNKKEDLKGEFTADKIILTATRGYLTLTTDSSDCVNYGIGVENGNDVRFIKKDGTIVSAFISYSSVSADGNVECGILYSREPARLDENSNMQMKMIAVDISEIEAIEINGTLIPLK